MARAAVALLLVADAPAAARLGIPVLRGVVVDVALLLGVGTGIRVLLLGLLRAAGDRRVAALVQGRLAGVGAEADVVGAAGEAGVRQRHGIREERRRVSGIGGERRQRRGALGRVPVHGDGAAVGWTVGRVAAAGVGFWRAVRDAGAV